MWPWCSTTFGIGADFDEELLARLATQGRGHFCYIETAWRLRRDLPCHTRVTTIASMNLARTVSACFLALVAGATLVSAQTGAPVAPTGVAASVSGTTVAMTWQPGAGPAPTGYQLEAALTAGGPAVGSVPVTPPSLTVANVPDGTYFIRVRAVNEVGVSPASNEVSVTVGQVACGTAPNAPQNLAQNVASGFVTFTWSPGAGGCAPTHYVISAGSAAGLSDIGSANVGLQTSLSTAAPPGIYFVRVAGANAWGTGPTSNEVMLAVGPSCTVPGAPQAFSAVASGTFASFQWQPPVSGDPPTSYLLEAGTSASGAELGVLPLSGLSFGTPAPPGSYYVRVRAQNACGAGPASPTQLLTIGCAPAGMPGTPSTTVTGASVSISWGAVSGATQYQLEVGTAAGASNLGTRTVAGTNAQLSALAPGTYFTRVRALNACGPGATSGEATFTIAQAQTATRVMALSGNLAFGSVTVGQSATATFTISNTGNSTLTYTSLTCSCDVTVFSASPTTGTVPPGGSKAVTVSFSPTAQIAYGGALSVVSDATSGVSAINVSGSGVVPPAVTAYYVWGGPGDTQYLGYWTCTFCQEFGTNSINNAFGPYGSAFSSTSMRNRFSQYGSAFNSYSACNQFASSAPGVYRADGSFVGVLTLNRFASQAITNAGIVNWLSTNVCQ